MQAVVPSPAIYPLQAGTDKGSTALANIDDVLSTPQTSSSPTSDLPLQQVEASSINTEYWYTYSTQILSPRGPGYVSITLDQPNDASPMTHGRFREWRSGGQAIMTAPSEVAGPPQQFPK